MYTFLVSFVLVLPLAYIQALPAPPRPALRPPTTADLPKDEWVVTEQTEVKLDGKPCALADVPPGAEIVLLEVDSKQRVVKKLHFRSP